MSTFLGIQVDPEDLPGIRHGQLRSKGGTYQIKFPAWSRWKDLAVYITGAICAHRNDDQSDFRRDNLVPCAKAWERYR
jgi:hypothetical protein